MIRAQASIKKGKCVDKRGVASEVLCGLDWDDLSLLNRLYNERAEGNPHSRESWTNVTAILIQKLSHVKKHYS